MRQWLDDLLPDNAAQLCSGGHVQIVVTTLPFLTRQVISNFTVRVRVVWGSVLPQQSVCHILLFSFYECSTSMPHGWHEGVLFTGMMVSVHS